MSVRLFVLGVLSEREAHGYEIKQLARAWDLAQWAEIGYGSIYHALAKLEDEGLIEEVAVEQEGNRPPRSVYRITERGRQAFLELLRETCRSVYSPKDPLDLALAFLAHSPPKERVSLLQERLRELERIQKAVQAKMERLRASGYAERFPWVEAVLEHDLAHRDLEIRWTRELIKKVKRWPSRTEEPSEQRRC